MCITLIIRSLCVLTWCNPKSAQHAIKMLWIISSYHFIQSLQPFPPQLGSVFITLEVTEMGTYEQRFGAPFEIFLCNMVSLNDLYLWCKSFFLCNHWSISANCITAHYRCFVVFVSLFKVGDLVVRLFQLVKFYDASLN